MSAIPTGPMVDHAIRQPDDTDSHIERINPGDNPAAVPWAAGAFPVPEVPADRGPLRPFVALGRGTHGSRLLRGGETVWLYADEAGPNYRAMPLQGPVPADVSIPLQGLTAEDRDRLHWLRSQEHLGVLESDEEAALAAREALPRPRPPLVPLTDSEWEYLAWLRTPDRPLLPDEQAELQIMNARAAISPPRMKAGPTPADPDVAVQPPVEKPAPAPAVGATGAPGPAKA